MRKFNGAFCDFINDNLDNKELQGALKKVVKYYLPKR